MSFPREPEDLTAEWLGEQLGAEVKGFDIEQIGVGVGMIGRLYRLTLDDGTSVVAKFPTADPGARTNVAGPLRLYQREARFYAELAASTPMATPTVHASMWDDETGDFVLLLEDLSTMRSADQIAGCSVADAEVVIDAIAAHHARFAAPDALAAHDWVPGFDDVVMQAVVAGMAQQGLPLFMEGFGGTLDARKRSFIEGLPAAVGKFMTEPEEGTITLAHVDLRLDNIFFGADDRPLVVIDWQLSSQAGLAYDVAYFLSQSMDTDVRRAHEADLIDRYLGALDAHGVSVNRSGFDIDYRRTVAFCAIYPVNVAGNIELANERAVALCRSLLDRAMAAIDDHDALAVWPG